VLLSFVVAAPAAANATVERQRITRIDHCEDHIDTDPVTGEETFYRFCTSGRWVITTVLTPSGVQVMSGSVRSTLSIYFMGEVQTQQNTETHRFHNVTRDELAQVLHERLQTTQLVIGGETTECYVRYHVANGEVRYGEPALICEGDDDGGGEG
jgi:hypothetical protein